MKLSGNTALITGGGTGIGLALAEALVDRGNQVVICGRRREKLLAAKKKVPGLRVRVCDVSAGRSRRALVEWVLSEFDDLNIVINNAGIQRPVDFLRGPDAVADVNREIATNLAAPIHLTALLIRHLRRRAEAAIVNVSSGLAFTPIAAIPVYCATKAALHTVSLCLRRQLRETPVRVFEIIPPMVATDLGGDRRRRERNPDAMTPKAVAAAVMDAVERNEYEVAIGAAARLHAQREALFSTINSR